MERLLATILVGASAAFLLASVPSEGSYPYNPGWRNISAWNSSGHRVPSPGWVPPPPGRTWPQRNSSSYVPYYRNSSAYWPAGRYPRSTPYLPTSNSSHNFIWGVRGPYDRLLYFTRVKRGSSWLRKTIAEVDFPPRHQRPNGTITAIHALDQKPPGKGGYVTVIRGGIGYQNVTLRFKSQRGEGFDYAVSIYGRDYPPIFG